MADVISRLKLESGEFDSKIKRAGQELLAYSEHCRKMGLEMGYANRDAKEFAKQFGSMATVSTTARGKINELSEAFVNAKVMYKNMTDEEKKGEFGRNLAASLDQLKTRLNDAKKDLADVTNELNGSKFGQFGSVIDTIGSKLGVTGNLTEMLTSQTALLTGAVGAGIAVVTKATEAWANYNAELAKQDQITQVTTGLKGEDADRMTDKMRALSDTYNVDFREAVNAANTLMTQFGKTGDEATQLIKDGMRGMIQGDGPKLLSMIQQYAPAFRDAGVSASQLVAVIQNSEGGIFTDQNMNAIVMGIKNIRLMTKATSDALAQLGIDGQKMSKQLSDGSLTVFDALKQVAAQLQTVDSNSKTAGEVMQQVFGRQGVTAGTNLAKAIETLNTNLEDTKKQTGELGDALADLQTANEKLNTAIRDCFEYDGWDQMATGIRANLITALADVLSYLGRIRKLFGSLVDEIRTGLGQTVSRTGGEGFGGGGAGGGIRGGNNNPAPRPQPRSTKSGGNTAKQEQTELQQNQKKINDLVQQYVNLASKGLSVDDDRLSKLREDISLLEKRNSLLGVYAEQAKGRFLDEGKVEMPKNVKGVSPSILQDIKVPLQLDEKAMKALTSQIKEATKPQKEEKISISGMLGQLAGGLNSIDSGLSQLGIDLGDGFRSVVSGITAVTTILSGISALVTIITAIQGTKAVPVIGWALANGGVIHAASGYTVPGNNYSGDMVPAMLNSGELVLNRAQQGNLASQLNGGGMQNIQLEAFISGEQIMLASTNRGRRTGRGEIVQSRRAR